MIECYWKLVLLHDIVHQEIPTFNRDSPCAQCTRETSEEYDTCPTYIPNNVMTHDIFPKNDLEKIVEGRNE